MIFQTYATQDDANIDVEKKRKKLIVNASNMVVKKKNPV